MRWIALLCCFLIASIASAKDLKIGIVDMQKLFNSYPGTQKAKDKLAALEKKKNDDLSDEAQELKDLEKQLGDSSVLSEKQKEKKTTEYKTKLATFSQDQEQAQKELMAKESDMTQTIVGEIKDIVASVAKDKDIDLVLDQDKTVYAKDAVDLTADVSKQFKTADKGDDSK